MKTAPPQHVLPKYYDGVRRQLEQIFYLIVFKPLLEIVAAATSQASTSKTVLLKNARGNALRDAMRSGRVQYQCGAFSGQFSAAISSQIRAMGATFDPKTKTFVLARPPAWVLAEAVSYQTTAKAVHERLKKALDQIQKNLDQSVESHPVNAHKTVDEFESGFSPVSKMLEVSPRLSQTSRAALAKDYSDNMKLWIQDFSVNEIQSLRKVVEENATEGYRFDELMDGIKRRYGVAASKAKFLARQETALYMSKFRRQRFEEAGVTRYRWSTSHDERVRSSHRHLDGRVFLYSDPPITDPATAAKNNPGEDFNCRCVDIAILATTTSEIQDDTRRYRQLVKDTHPGLVAA